MELYRPRSSSILRKLHQTAKEERFSLADAAHLKLKLRALDHALSTNSHDALHAHDIKQAIDACQLAPSHGNVYVDGSEEMYLVVKTLSRPDLIPDVYVEAYTAALHGRTFVNERRVSNFKKGVDPTFSQIRPLLKDIDHVCDTKLEAAYKNKEDNGKHTVLHN